MLCNIQKIINFIYPPKCLLCAIELDNYGLCYNCYNSLKIAHNTCNKCGFLLPNGNGICLACYHKKIYFDSILYRHIYDDSIYRIIYQFKQNDELYLADYLSNILKQSLLQIDDKKFDVIIPVPMHPLKLIKKKYSHMVILAHKLSKLTGISYSFSALKKIKNTKEQKELSAKARMINLQGAFEVNQKHTKLIKNKIVLLIDDVITTGVTIQECAKTLKKAGAQEVHVLAIARVEGILKI